MGNFKKDVFGEGGMLHRYFGKGYEQREEQINMSVATAKTILNRSILLAEAAVCPAASATRCPSAVATESRTRFVSADPST